MLTELSIENLGVIERATLQLKRGMTVLTGETGAGKTILVDAIKLVMGGRTDPAIVRHGTDEARVDARFEVIDDGQLVERVVSRVVPAEGRSRAYLDGRPVTASTLADLSADLVELHGQHAHQRLLSTSAQRQVVDHYGQIDLSNWHQLRRQDVELTATQAELGGDERARAREIDLLEFQIAEIAAAELDDPDEDLHLAADEALLAHAADHQEAGQRVLYAFDSDQGISDQVSSVLGELDGRQPYHGITDRLNALAADLDDAVRDLRHLAESIEDDPQRLEEIRVRRQLLADLRRKYGDNLA
ncbi:MAG: DNA repair protein RecN, partial [Ilumatobacter coccineus]